MSQQTKSNRYNGAGRNNPMTPTVSIITPTTASRSMYMPRLKEMINSQEYPNIIEWLVCNQDGTIGGKRNILSEQAKGEIIIAMDSDDLYSWDWVSKSVRHLLYSDAQLTGLSDAYFYDVSGQLYKWAWNGQQPYVCEATMCYYRSMWACNHFPDTSNGEGMRFMANAGRIIPHSNINSFVATIHGQNTAVQNSIVYFKEVGAEFSPDILKKYYP